MIKVIWGKPFFGCQRMVFPRFRSLNRRKSASCGHCLFRLISPPMKFPPQAVIGGSSPFPKTTPEHNLWFFYFLFSRDAKGKKFSPRFNPGQSVRPFVAFSEGGAGETSLWPPKRGFPRKINTLFRTIPQPRSAARRIRKQCSPACRISVPAGGCGPRRRGSSGLPWPWPNRPPGGRS